MTPEQIAELRALAEKATPRDAHYELFRYHHGGGRAWRIEGTDRKLIADLYHIEDREFFAACDPQTVLALCDAAERAARLEGFARDILHDFPESGPDAFHIQDIAVKHGILVPHRVTEPCGENCWCAEYHGSMSEGVTCYRLAPELAALADGVRRNDGNA